MPDVVPFEVDLVAHEQLRVAAVLTAMGDTYDPLELSDRMRRRPPSRHRCDATTDVAVDSMSRVTNDLRTTHVDPLTRGSEPEPELEQPGPLVAALAGLRKPRQRKPRSS